MRPIALHKLEPIGARLFEETGGKNNVVQHMPKHLDSHRGVNEQTILIYKGSHRPRVSSCG